MHGKMGQITKLKPKQNALSISLEINLILIFEVVRSRGEFIKYIEKSEFLVKLESRLKVLKNQGGTAINFESLQGLRILV